MSEKLNELKEQKAALEKALQCGRSKYEVWCGPKASGTVGIDLELLLKAVNVAIELIDVSNQNQKGYGND